MPKRAIERRRRNLSGDVDTIVVAGRVTVPAADAAWHPIAIRWYRSLRRSGQQVYYEPSDWAAAQLVAEAMTKLLKRRTFSAEAFAAIWKAMTDLLTTEAARRRARIEIQREIGTPTDDAKVSAIDDYRKSLGADEDETE